MKILIIYLLFAVSVIYSQTAEEYFEEGKIKYDKFDYVGSINDFKKAVDLKPDYFDAYFYMGKAHMLVNQNEKANLEFSKTIELQPDNVDIYNLRGSTFFNLRQYINANLDFSKAIELSPDKPIAYFNRGIGNALLLDTIGACTDFKKALELGYNPEIGKKYLDQYCK